MEIGLAFAQQALARGPLLLWEIEELPDEATVVTVSLVGAPAAPQQRVTPDHFVRAVMLLSERLEGTIAALVTSENGGFATVNGWYQSAVLGIPVVDAPCNGRAHPLGLMGAMGLHRPPGYRACAAAVGGGTEGAHLVEEVSSGSVQEVAWRVREAAIRAGGLVAVARNPVEVSYVRAHAAVGALSQAICLGALLSDRASADGRLQALTTLAGAQVLAKGKATAVSRRFARGFDVGSVVVSASTGRYELTFYNEYITVERAGHRLATFPDVIATLQQETLQPLTTASLESGQKVFLVVIPWTRLKLGAGMRDPSLYGQVASAVGKEVLPPDNLESGR